MHIPSFALAALLALPLVGDVAPDAGPARTYHVEQSVTLSGIPAGSKLVKWWIAIPGDDRFQDVLDLSVASAPGDWRIVTEPDHGNRFLYLEVPAPATDSLTTKVDFLVRRRPVFIDVDPARVGPITDSHRKLFVDELRQDAPHMEATPQIKAMADTACALETNVALQARKLLDAVADYADHYSKDPSKPKCGIGDAGDCMTNRGGCCTDLHSLFIALARSRGIPARMEMGYRLKEANAGKDVDPGYRCWVEYFLPGYGWVPADIVEADAPDGLGRTRWFSGLTERRVWLDEGRELDLAGRAAAHKVNTMVVGYAEIDGVEARVIPDGDKPAQLSRMVHYTEVEPVTR
jgi:transglutaminase-like putative cysteine protease